MIRILQMIGSLEMGGSQSMIMNIYRNIDRNSVQFDFIVDRVEHMEYKEEIEALGGLIYVMPTFRGKNILKIKKAWKDFFEQHPEYKVLHSHVRSYASLYIPIAKRYGLITIIHSHSTSNGKGIQAIIKKIMQYPLRYQADYLFACSNKAGAWLFGKSALKDKNYKVIPNAIDSMRFIYDENKRSRIRKQLHIEDKFVIGNVGRFVTPKNQLFLLNIFADILHREKNSCLLLVGDGELRSILEERCQQLGIQDAVIFSGSRSNIEDYYMGMDVFAFPSLWEGLGIAVIEAQTAGLPCVVSDAVPLEVDIGSGLTDVVKISDDSEKWADRICAQKGKVRINQDKAVKKAGYEVSDSAYRLQKFYQEIGRNGRI